MEKNNENADREVVKRAMFEGILSGYVATAHEGEDDFSRCQTLTEMALSAIEASQFRVERIAVVSQD